MILSPLTPGWTVFVVVVVVAALYGTAHQIIVSWERVRVARWRHHRAAEIAAEDEMSPAARPAPAQVQEDGP